MARSRGRSTQFSVDTTQIARLARSFRDLSPEIAKDFRAEIRRAGDAVAAEARERASVSSRKIPATVRRTGSTGSMKISAGGPGAPNAAPFENEGREGFFRHPTFGHDPWVNQQAHPFLAPALANQSPILSARIDAAIDRAIASLEDGDG